MQTKNTYFIDKVEFQNFVSENLFDKEKTLLVQVFTSELDRKIIENILSDIKYVLPQATIIGTTTDGEILENIVTTDKTVVSISSFENSSLSVAYAQNNNDSWSCGNLLAKKIVTSKTKLLILFSDGLSINGEYFLDGVQDVSNDIIIAGGMAGDSAKFKNTYIFCNDEFLTKGAVGVAIDSDILKVKSAYSFNWQEIGKRLTVTKAKDNIVYEIDNIKAVDIYARYLGDSVAQALPETGIEFPLIINKDGVKVARAVIGKNDDGSLIFAGNIQIGDSVHFGIGNSDKILSKSVDTRKSFKYTPIESIFVYSCMARRRFLQDSIKDELTPFSDIAPTSGFFTYGEFYKAKNCELLNQTMTVITMSENNEPVTRDFTNKKEYKNSLHYNKTYKALSHLVQVTSDELAETNANLEKLVELKTIELQNKISELEQASNVKSQFISNISHEIRTPLNAMFGFIEILKATETDPKKLEYFNIINNSGNSLLKVVNDILDFSTIKNGKILLAKTKFNLKEPFKELANIFFNQAIEQNKHFKVIFADNLPKYFFGDSTRIKQIALNILSNALKFTTDDGIIEMSLGFDEVNKYLVLGVKDDGIGIEENKLNEIFEDFSQVDLGVSKRFGGAGLGLSISKELLDAMGGKIIVESELNKGSNFMVYIPYIDNFTNDEILKEDNKKVSNINKLSGNVLLVEDDKSNQTLMTMILKTLNLKVEIANNGLEAVEKYKSSITDNKSSFNLILMDEDMPKMKGTQASQVIRTLEKNKDLKSTPIVAVTANILDYDKEVFLSAGMNDFICKPLDYKEFMNIITTYCS